MRGGLLATFDAKRPRARGAWYRAHGLGNDYLVFEEGEDWTVSVKAVERVCHRTKGVGSDGIVLLLGGAEEPFRLRMFNPDGGEFERSGNGLRILASHLLRTRRVVLGRGFEVEVGGERVAMEVHTSAEGGIYDISVEMGRARVGPEAVSLKRDALTDAGELQVPGAGVVRIETVSVGNPHAVVFTDDLTVDALHRMGPGLATHTAFAQGTNVQLARPVEGARAVEALIWERGVGPTSASGTSACAVAVAAVHTGRLTPGPVEVRMEGGVLLVHVGPELEVVLRGPVQEVATGDMTQGFLDWLSAS